MIERKAFLRAWTTLCARFGRANDGATAAAYYEYLKDQLDTPGFLAAANAVWATGRWFPRPADFLLVSASAEWSIVLDALEEYASQERRWGPIFQQLSPRGKAATLKLGGIPAMRPIYERDVLRLKEAFERAYEQVAAENARDLALPAPEPDHVKMLRPA